MGKLVPATEFKAKCLALIAEMERSGEPLTITRRGKPSLTLTAKRVPEGPRKPLFGCLKGSVAYNGDIVGPALHPEWEEEWNAKWDERLRDEPQGDGFRHE